MGKLIVLMGKSATGKDTIHRALLNKEELNLKTVISYTTRPIRINEKDGVEYHFVTEDTLASMRDENKVIECRSYNTVKGVWSYFTADDGQIDIDKGSYIIIGTLESYHEIVRFYGEDKVVPIYIKVSDDDRLIRSILREKEQKNPNYKEICRRFLADEEDFSSEKLGEINNLMTFTNNNLDDTITDISDYIMSL